jgi:hypothetical protein
MVRRASVFVVVALMSCAICAHAQDNIELGVDWGVGMNAGGDTQWFVDIPASQFRAGFWLSDRFSVEPRIGYTLRSNGGTDHRLNLGLNGLVFLSQSAERVRGYGVIGAGWIWSNFEGAGANSDFSVGAGAGLWLPMTAQLATRLEGRYDRIFRGGGADAGNVITLLVGLSFTVKPIR